MKIFLITSIIAMITAGIYGTVDLAKDINQGTFIQYEKENVREIRSFIVSNKNLSQLANTIKVETKKEEKITEPNVSDLKIEYFSRGEPPYFSAPEELVVSDSVNNVTDSVAIIPLTSITTGKTGTEKVATVIPPKEERKFSPKLFSRSRPYRVVKEIAAALADTAEKQ